MTKQNTPNVIPTDWYNLRRDLFPEPQNVPYHLRGFWVFCFNEQPGENKYDLATVDSNNNWLILERDYNEVGSISEARVFKSLSNARRFAREQFGYSKLGETRQDAYGFSE